MDIKQSSSDRWITAPGGVEVEGTRAHVPIPVPVDLPIERRELSTPESMRGRLEAWKSRGMHALVDARSAIATRTDGLKRTASEKLANVKPAAQRSSLRMQQQMRANPGTWAGIAAGAGFAFGLAGRYLRMRSRSRHPIPTFVVVETSC